MLEEPNATHNVIATARGIFGCEGGTLTSNETGVTIIIPPGAISEGEKHEIYFKVCQDSSMLPPLDKDKGIIIYLIYFRFMFIELCKKLSQRIEYNFMMLYQFYQFQIIL